MSKPPRPRVTEDDIKRAYDIKERLALEGDYKANEESAEWDSLCADAERVYTLLSRMKSYDDLYGHE